MRLGARTGWLAAALLGASALGVSSTATAQTVACAEDESFPCSNQAEGVQLQRVPSLMKFQARVSQAKLPVGEAVFNTIIVKLIRGANEVLCQEEFANVIVNDSVLNLTIGQNMSCELDEVVAENTDLNIQVCLGSASNCLQPIELGATPYALKASFASTAQNANSANSAAQAHYSHRATADRKLQFTKRLGTGYVDFFTHPTGTQGSLYTDEQYAQYEDGGFIQWTPVRDRGAMNLHICGKSQATDELVELDNLVLASEGTHATGALKSDGALTVSSGGASVSGDSSIDGTLNITGQTRVEDGGLFVTGGGVDVTGNAELRGDVTVRNGGMNVEGQSVLMSGLSVEGASIFNGPVQFEAGFSIEGQPGPIPNEPTAETLYINRTQASDTTGDYDFLALAGKEGMLLSGGNGDVRVQSPASFDGAATFSNGATFNGPLIANGSISGQSMTLAQGATVTGTLTAQGPAVLESGATVTGDVSASGNVSATGSVDAAGALEGASVSVKDAGGAEVASISAAGTLTAADVVADGVSLKTRTSDHSARHEQGGADAINVESLGTAETDTKKVLGPDGSGGLAFVSAQSVFPKVFQVSFSGTNSTATFEPDEVEVFGDAGITISTSGRRVVIGEAGLYHLAVSGFTLNTAPHIQNLRLLVRAYRNGSQLFSYDVRHDSGVNHQYGAQNDIERWVELQPNDEIDVFGIGDLGSTLNGTIAIVRWR